MLGQGPLHNNVLQQSVLMIIHTQVVACCNACTAVKKTWGLNIRRICHAVAGVNARMMISVPHATGPGKRHASSRSRVWQGLPHACTRIVKVCSDDLFVLLVFEDIFDEDIHLHTGIHSHSS